MRYPRIQEKLQRELDGQFGAPGLSANDGGNHDDTEDRDIITPFEQAKQLPYLGAVINEALRIHSISAMGLPRVVPNPEPSTTSIELSHGSDCEDLKIGPKRFPPGTVLSVPSYTIHRDPTVWGSDAEAFRPERWFKRGDAIKEGLDEGEDTGLMGKVFNPFSYGPR